MMHWLHTNSPQPILWDLGLVRLHWYGLLVVGGIVGALLMAETLAKKYDFSKAKLLDLAFWIIVWGIIGARLYHIGLEYQYYLANPWNILKIWQGGLAIHGGLIAGVLVIYYFVKKYHWNFWLLGSIIVPGLALAQAIGRWGNYFNQELFGQPTNLSWGIPISQINRVAPYLQYDYFHPTFLYESLGNLCLSVVLLLIHYSWHHAGIAKHRFIVLSYLVGYSLLRFSLEFIRLDPTPLLLGLRWPQWVSLGILVASFGCLVYYKWIKKV